MDAIRQRSNSLDRLNINPYPSQLEKIGTGSRAHVYRATGNDGCHTALKIQSADTSKKQDDIEFEFMYAAFLKRAKRDKLLSSNVHFTATKSMTESLQTFGNKNKPAFLIQMELMGETLKDYAKNTSHEKMRSITRSMVKSFISLIKKGFLMRDMHTENILMKNGKPHFSDFGSCSLQKGSEAYYLAKSMCKNNPSRSENIEQHSLNFKDIDYKIMETNMLSQLAELDNSPVIRRNNEFIAIDASGNHHKIEKLHQLLNVMREN